MKFGILLALVSLSSAQAFAYCGQISHTTVDESGAEVMVYTLTTQSLPITTFTLQTATGDERAQVQAVDGKTAEIEGTPAAGKVNTLDVTTATSAIGCPLN